MTNIPHKFPIDPTERQLCTVCGEAPVYGENNIGCVDPNIIKVDDKEGLIQITVSHKFAETQSKLSITTPILERIPQQKIAKSLVYMAARLLRSASTMVQVPQLEPCAGLVERIAENIKGG